MDKKLCAIFGEEPHELPFGYDEEHVLCTQMKMRLICAIDGVIRDGCTGFISTLAQGAAMWGGEACTAIKAFGGNIKFIAAPTDDGQASRWHPERRERYYRLLGRADLVIEPVGILTGEEYVYANADRAIILGDIANQRLNAVFLRAKKQGMSVYLV